MRSNEVVRELRAGVAHLAATDPVGLDPVSLADTLVELRQVVDRVEAHWLRYLSAFAAADGAAHAATSTAGWLRATCRLAPGDARARVLTARRLRDQPAVAAALATGEITLPHAVLITRAVAELADATDPDTAADVEEPLVAAARELDPTRLAREIAHARHALAPEAANRDEQTRHARRRLSLRPGFDAMTGLDGLLDPEGAETVQTALAALAGPTGADDARTPAQRRADALVELCRHALDGGQLPAHGRQRPHLVVTVGLDTLRGLAGSPAADTTWAGPVTAETARRLACDAAITRVILDPNSEPLDVGRRTRTIPPAIRTALNLRDRGCVFPGCDRPPPWTEAHHVIHWLDGGHTALHNLVLLCARHHHTIHTGTWHITRDPDSHWHIHPTTPDQRQRWRQRNHAA